MRAEVGSTGAVASRPGIVVLALVALVGVLALLAGSHLGAALAAQLVVILLCVPAWRWCRRASRVTRERWSLGWRLLSWGAALWALGNIVTVVSVALLPGRGLNTAIYPLQGASIVAVLAALLVMPRPPWGRGTALRTQLDVVLLVSSLALLGSVSLVDYATRRAEGADLVFAIAYPSASLLMLGLAYELSRRHVHPPRPEIAMITAAVAAWLVGGSAYATLTPDAVVAPAWASWLVGIGVVLLAVGARQVTRGEEPYRVELGSWSARAVLAAPEIAVVLAAVTVIFAGLGHWVQQSLAAVVTVSVLARHVVATSDARRFHWRMESEVAERTADLRRLSERYVGILNTVGDGIVSIDAAGRIRFANLSARRMLDTPDSLVGGDACQLLCVTRSHECPFDQVREGRVLRGVEAELRRSDGAVVPVELHAAPELDPALEARGAVIAFRDVSERHAVEQVKRQFVSSVSHELRTPLSSVRGVLEMFVDGDAGELSPEGTMLAANASRGVERLSRLVDDIIDAEKLASGEFRMQRSRVDLGQLLREAVVVLQPLAANAGARVVVEAASVPAVWGDTDRIEQALVNLVGNALKFSPRDGVVTVSAAVHGEDALVSVRDQGPGIPADHLEHVFERFHQVAAADAAEKGGTGLGLTITRAIVHQHGGRVWAESTLGEGSTFCFTLPLARSAPAMDAAVEVAADAADPAAGSPSDPAAGPSADSAAGPGR